MEQVQTQKNNVSETRAKQIDTGATPLPMSNVIIGLPRKPSTPALDTRVGATAQTWTWESIVSQRRKIADIKVDQSSKGVIWSFHNTWSNVLKTIFRNQLESLFTLKSWTIVFEFEFRTNFQQVGQFVVFYSNLPSNNKSYHFNLQQNTDPDPYEDYLIQTQLPHRKIPMGESVDVNVDLKWLSPMKGAFGNTSMLVYGSTPSDTVATDDLYDMGTLFLAVPWPMELGMNVTPDCSVRIWASLADVTYAGWMPNDTSI